MTGQVFFFLAAIAGAGVTGWKACAACLTGGPRVAAQVTIWHVLSLLAYILVCLWLGFGWEGQALAGVAALVLDLPAVRRERRLRRG